MVNNIRLCCKFRPNGVVKLDDLPQQMSALFGYPPASGARDLGYQMANVESFEQAPHRRARSALFGWLEESPEQGLPDVAVAKATHNLVAI